MNLREAVHSNVSEFVAACKAHDVAMLYAFGSSIGSGFDEARSDVDWVIELDTKDPIERGQKLLDLWDVFESFFGRKVDLLTPDSISNPVLAERIRAVPSRPCRLRHWTALSRRWDFRR